MSDLPCLRLLVVDEQASVRKLCSTLGASLGFVCSEAESAAAALDCLDTTSPHLVLAGLKMENGSGPKFVEQVEKLLPEAEVVLLTDCNIPEGAVQAMKLGAYDYIAKPFQAEELKLVLERLAEKILLMEENRLLRQRLNALEGTLPASPGGGPGLECTDLEEMERATIRRVFEEVRGDKSLAGRKLGISRATLYRKLKRYGIRGRA